MRYFANFSQSGRDLPSTTFLKARSGAGFTLIEVFVSLTIMTVAILGLFILVRQTVSALPLSGQRLVASYLAQEGVEIVRNLRDANRLRGVNWDLGLTSCTAGCEADYASQSLAAWTSRYLKLDSSFYSYGGSTATPYQRKITLTPNGSDILMVNVEIFWSEKERSHTLSVREDLYNW